MTLTKVFLGTEMEAALVRDSLEENGIKAVLQGVNVANMLPYLATPAGAGSVSVCVADDDAEQARTLIAQGTPTE